MGRRPVTPRLHLPSAVAATGLCFGLAALCFRAAYHAARDAWEDR